MRHTLVKFLFATLTALMFLASAKAVTSICPVNYFDRQEGDGYLENFFENQAFLSEKLVITDLDDPSLTADGLMGSIFRSSFVIENSQAMAANISSAPFRLFPRDGRMPGSAGVLPPWHLQYNSTSVAYDSWTRNGPSGTFTLPKEMQTQYCTVIFYVTCGGCSEALNFVLNFDQGLQRVVTVNFVDFGDDCTAPSYTTPCILASNGTSVYQRAQASWIGNQAYYIHASIEELDLSSYSSFVLRSITFPAPGSVFPVLWSIQGVRVCPRASADRCGVCSGNGGSCPISVFTSQNYIIRSDQGAVFLNVIRGAEPAAYVVLQPFAVATTSIGSISYKNASHIQITPPSACASGSKSFTVTAMHSVVTSNTANIVVALNLVMPVPVAAPISISTEAGATVELMLFAAPTACGPSLLKLASSPAKGTLRLLNGTPISSTSTFDPTTDRFFYTVNNNTSGEDIFTYYATSGSSIGAAVQVIISITPTAVPMTPLASAPPTNPPTASGCQGEPPQLPASYQTNSTKFTCVNATWVLNAELITIVNTTTTQLSEETVTVEGCVQIQTASTAALSLSPELNAALQNGSSKSISLDLIRSLAECISGDGFGAIQVLCEESSGVSKQCPSCISANQSVSPQLLSVLLTSNCEMSGVQNAPVPWWIAIIVVGAAVFIAVAVILIIMKNSKIREVVFPYRSKRDQERPRSTVS